MRLIAIVLTIIGLTAILPTAASAYPSWSDPPQFAFSASYNRVWARGHIHTSKYRYAYHGRWHGGYGHKNPVMGLLARGLAQIVNHPAGCPARQFCGCGVSVRVFGHSVRDLWLARNWFRFPRSAPAAGNVAIFRGGGHVAYIEQVHGDGTVTLYDPNSGGHQTRIHRRSLAGAVIVNPRGGRYASK
jgi:CHAP domain-containing protein